jgi:outer membrane protein assembly factor BamB
MKTTKTTSAFLLLLISLIVLILICVNIIFPPPPTPTPTPLAPKKIFEPSDLFVKELWQKSGEVYVFEDPLMVLAADKIIVGFFFDRKITAFASRTGNTLWNVSFSGSLWSISVDTEAVYTVTDGIEAYTLDTGQSIWRNEAAKVHRHGEEWLDATPGSLNYYFHQIVSPGRIYNAFYGLNKSTGQVQDGFVEEKDVFFRQDEIKYTLEKNQLSAILSAIDTTNNQVLWTLNISGYPQRLPIVLDQVMYFITKEPNNVKNRKRTIYAINLPTGDVRWRIEDKIISNIAIGQESIFAVSDEGNILAWDIHTAEPIGEIIITPQIQGDRKYQNRYSVNANEQFLAAYYGDSQQLVVFELAKPISP